VPDVISSDIHQLAIQGPLFDLPTTLSKFLALGLSLAEVIERATVRPAKIIGRPELGSLAEGTPADIALFQVVEGTFTFYDVAMQARSGDRLLVNTLTMVDGRIVPRQEPSALHPWVQLPEHQYPIVQIGHPYRVMQARGG